MENAYAVLQNRELCARTIQTHLHAQKTDRKELHLIQATLVLTGRGGVVGGFIYSVFLNKIMTQVRR